MSWYVDMLELYAYNMGLDVRINYVKQSGPWILVLSDYWLSDDLLFNARKDYVFLAVF